MYESFYNLSDKPFRSGVNAQFFYASESHERALGNLHQGLAAGEGFIVVSGLPGLGKTTLARMLLDKVDSEQTQIAEIVTTHLTPKEMLQVISGSFGLPYKNLDEDTLIPALERYLIENVRRGRRSLLVIDEAHNLPCESMETLRVLSAMRYEGQPLMHGVLLGQENLLHKLKSEQGRLLANNIVASCLLRPLNVIETRGYIEHRLHSVNWDRDPKITDSAFKIIYEKTHGVPRRINLFCDHLLLYCRFEELHLIDDHAVRDMLRETDPMLFGPVEEADVGASEVDAGVLLEAPAPKHGTAEAKPQLESPLVELEEPDTTDDRSVLANVAKRSEPERVEEYALLGSANDDATSTVMDRHDVASIPAVQQKVRTPATATVISNKTFEGDARVEELRARLGAEAAKKSVGAFSIPRFWALAASVVVTVAVTTVVAIHTGPNAITTTAQDVETVAGTPLLQVEHPSDSNLNVLEFDDGVAELVVEPWPEVAEHSVADNTSSSAENVTPFHVKQTSKRTAEGFSSADNSITSVSSQNTSSAAIGSNGSAGISRAERFESIALSASQSERKRKFQGNLGFATVGMTEHVSAAPSSLEKFVEGESGEIVNDFVVMEVSLSSGGAALPDDRALSHNKPYIAEHELERLMKVFEYAYAEGDAELFSSLISEDIIVNDATGKKRIVSDYQEVFSSTLMRKLHVNDMSWDLQGQRALGNGKFELVVQSQNANVEKVYSGLMSVNIEMNTLGELYITELYHRYN